MCTEQGWALGQSSAPRGASILLLLYSSTPAGTQTCSYHGKKCRKCPSLGNFMLTMPIHGKILNQSYSHREAKGSGCLFISLSLIKPNRLLKIVLVPYANRQGMMQQVGNETGKWVISKLFLHLGLGKLPGLCFVTGSPRDTGPFCQEIFATACEVPRLWLSHLRARSPLHPQPCTSSAGWHELQTACDQRWATPSFSWGIAELTPLF